MRLATKSPVRGLHYNQDFSVGELQARIKKNGMNVNTVRPFGRGVLRMSSFLGNLERWHEEKLDLRITPTRGI